MTSKMPAPIGAPSAKVKNISQDDCPRQPSIYQAVTAGQPALAPVPSNDDRLTANSFSNLVDRLREKNSYTSLNDQRTKMFSITSFGKDGIRKIIQATQPPDVLSVYSQENREEKASPSKVYFKTLEMGQSFLNNKKRIKQRIQEEIESIKSSSAMEFKLVKAQIEAAKEEKLKQTSPERFVSPYVED